MRKVISHNSNYEIDVQGNIFNRIKGNQLSPAKNKKVEYLQVGLWKNNKGTSYYVHRLVAQAFIPNPDNLPEVNHIDGNRQNNYVSNLEWVDRQGNAIHAVQSGLKTYTNRLTQEEFEECLDMVINGMTYAELSTITPYQVPFLSTKLRKIARDIGLEDALNESLKQQRIVRAMKNLEKINS